MKAMKWYYAQNNQRQGPVSESEFDFLVHQKKILPGTLVWNETMTDWRPLREVQPEQEPPPAPSPSVWDAPRQPPPASAPERDGPAWEERDSIGGLKAATRTVRDLLGNSNWTFAHMKRVADAAGPFCFALFLGYLGYYANFAFSVIILRLNGGNLARTWILLNSDYFVGFLATMAYFFIPLFITLIVTLNSVVIHFSLALTGGVKQPFQTTWRVVNYSLGASMALLFIPVLGMPLATVWNLVLLTVGTARMHDVPPGRAVIAVAPVVLYTALFMLLKLKAG
jgi:hypothetical protein